MANLVTDNTLQSYNAAIRSLDNKFSQLVETYSKVLEGQENISESLNQIISENASMMNDINRKILILRLLVNGV